jgi:hypothetical protein
MNGVATELPIKIPVLLQQHYWNALAGQQECQHHAARTAAHHAAYSFLRVADIVSFRYFRLGSESRASGHRDAFLNFLTADQSDVPEIYLVADEESRLAMEQTFLFLKHPRHKPGWPPR